MGTACMHACVEPSVGDFFDVEVPWHAHQLTAEALTSVLREGGVVPAHVSVLQVKRTMFGAGEGCMSVMYRLELEYSDDANSNYPKKMVAKLTPSEIKPRIIGEFLHLFEAEVQYYKRGFAQCTGMRAPQCYFAAHGGYGRFLLLLEDLAPAKTPDQIVGVTPEEALMAAKAAARLHAKFRNSVDVSDETKPWVRLMDDEAYARQVRGVYGEAVRSLDDSRFKFFGLLSDDLPNVKAAMLWVEEHYDDFLLPLNLQDFKRTNPQSQFGTTLIHGDFRCENIFFPAENDTNAKLSEVTIIDYQLVKEGNPADDLAYFANSMTVETRRSTELEFLRTYFEEARLAGAVDLTIEELLLSYQFSLFVPLAICVIAQKDTAADANERSIALFRGCFERLEEQLADWNYLAACELRLEKWRRRGEFGVVGKYTREELLSVLPRPVHELLD